MFSGVERVGVLATAGGAGQFASLGLQVFPCVKWTDNKPSTGFLGRIICAASSKQSEVVITATVCAPIPELREQLWLSSTETKQVQPPVLAPDVCKAPLVSPIHFSYEEKQTKQ